MHRDKFTEKLVRIIGVIEAHSLPVKVRELYVFGSYSRGAIEPGDLDLIVVYDPPSREYNDRLLAESEERGIPLWEICRKAAGQFQASIRRALRKRGEPVQICLASDVREVTGDGSKVNPDDVVLIWSATDRNWQSKLAALKPDEPAGRAPRNHIVPLTRVHDSVGEMEAAVGMIEREQLSLTRVSVDSISVQLNEYHSRRLANWTRNKLIGRKSLEVMPYALWWFQQNRVSYDWRNRTELFSVGNKHRAELGKPSHRWMIWKFTTSPAIKSQCLIPHLKTKQPNELLVFERGRLWQTFKNGDPAFDFFGWREETAQHQLAELT